MAATMRTLIFSSQHRTSHEALSLMFIDCCDLLITCSSFLSVLLTHWKFTVDVSCVVKVLNTDWLRVHISLSCCAFYFLNRCAIRVSPTVQLGQHRTTMKFAVFLCLTSAAVLGVLAAKSKTEESHYFASPPKHGGDTETEAKTDDLGGEMTEEDDTSENEDDAKAPPLPKIPQKKKTTCTCPKTTAKTTPTEPTMSWEALQELLDVIRDIGPVSGTSHVQFELRINTFLL